MIYSLFSFNMSTGNSVSLPWALVSANARMIQEVFSSRLNAFVRNQYFMPLFRNLSTESSKKIEENKLFFEGFWNSHSTAYADLVYRQEILTHFKYRYETVHVYANRCPVQVECLIIESKNINEKDSDCYNFIHILGNLSTVNNDIMSTYPFLSAYLKNRKSNDESSARFIIISQYNTTKTEGDEVYKVHSVGEAGRILSDVIKNVTKKYQEIHQIVAHSLGSIVFASALEFFEATDPVAKNILFDRGPSSILTLSYRILGIWSNFLYPLYPFKTWIPNVGKQIADFINKKKDKEPLIVISGSPSDHVFPREANLCFSPELKPLHESRKLSILSFDLPSQRVPRAAMHTAGNDCFSQDYLLSEYKEQDVLRGDHLADAIIRRSVPPH